MITDNNVYLFQGIRGCIRYKVSADNSDVEPDYLEWGSEELVEAFDDAMNSGRLINLTPGIGDFDIMAGEPTVEFIKKYVDQVAYAVHFAAQNELHRTSPLTKAEYYNQMAINACNIMGDIFNKSGLGFMWRLMERKLGDVEPGGTMLSNWKQLLCVVNASGIQMTFCVDTLYQVMREHSTIPDEIDKMPVLITSYGTDFEKNMVVSVQLSLTDWRIEDDDKVVVKSSNYRSELKIQYRTVGGPVVPMRLG